MHLLLAFGVFCMGYFFWSRYIERNLNVDCIRPTPAIEKYNGIDFVPTKPLILFGHHFSSIAGVGPIIGPILALKFGWLPTFLWLVIGVVLIGAVHDFASIMMSVRNEGKTVGGIMEDYIGRIAGRVYLVFTFLSVVLVIAVFTRVVAKSFALNAVSASTSVFITAFAPVLGMIIRRRTLSQIFSVALGVVFLVVSLFLGRRFTLNLDEGTWVYLLLAYSFFASWLPVWVMLQPRDYLNFFMLVSFIIFGVVGILYIKPQIKMFALPEGAGPLEVITYIFPFLFVTVACGAVSGFHSLVSSGTTSKQISSECHARPVGYGAMLVESLLGVISLTALAIFSYDHYLELVGEGGDKVIDAFSYGMAKISVGVSPEFVKDFSVVALSAFALTSLDTAARIGRYVLGELVSSFWRSDRHEHSSVNGQVGETLRTSVFLSTAVILLAYFLASSGKAMTLWQLFGTSNQLLAAFALMTSAVWARRNGYKNFYFLIPAIFMFVVTVSALAIQLGRFLAMSAHLLASISLVLMVASVFLIFTSMRSYFGGKRT